MRQPHYRIDAGEKPHAIGAGGGFDGPCDASACDGPDASLRVGPLRHRPGFWETAAVVLLWRAAQGLALLRGRWLRRPPTPGLFALARFELACRMGPFLAGGRRMLRRTAGCAVRGVGRLLRPARLR